MSVIEGVEAVTVHVTDVERSRKFYAEVLGLQEVGPYHPNVRARFALPGTTTLLTMHIQGPDEGGRDPGTVSGILFNHHDPVAACEEIRARGGTIVHAPELLQTPLMSTMLGVFADPDGNEFVIRSPPVYAK